MSITSETHQCLQSRRTLRTLHSWWVDGQTPILKNDFNNFLSRVPFKPGTINPESCAHCSVKLCMISKIYSMRCIGRSRIWIGWGERVLGNITYCHPSFHKGINRWRLKKYTERLLINRNRPSEKSFSQMRKEGNKSKEARVIMVVLYYWIAKITLVRAQLREYLEKCKK